MKTFEFSIVASGIDRTADDFESRFYDHGCDDATVSFQKGHIILDFARDADDLEDAINSAMRDVASVGATVERVEPEPLVSLSDIAERTGLSKAAISLYVSGARGQGFPLPVARITSSTPLWKWTAVAHWMVEAGKMQAEAWEDAKVIQRVNAKIEFEAA